MTGLLSHAEVPSQAYTLSTSPQAAMSSSIGCHLVPSNSHSVRFLDSFAIVGGIQTAHVRTRLPRVDTVARPASRSRDTEQVDAVGDVQIDGVNRDYCDDFVCTSSPLVEQTVKALARDLLRQRTWTSSLFSPSVEYRVRPHATPHLQLLEDGHLQSSWERCTLVA